MHTLKNHFGIYIIGGLLSLLLAGCAANVGKTIKVSEEQLTKYGALSATDAVAALEKRVNEAKDANMTFFAPNHFRGASEILAAAQKSPDKRPKNELLGDIAKADAILDKGHAMMAIVKTRFAGELALKDQMGKDNVAGVFPKEYEKSVSELSNLMEKVELEKADNLDKDKSELIKKMQALDVKTIQYTTLHESEVINKDTDSNDGEDQAPVTLAEALRVYKNSLEQIASSPHDEVAVKRAGDEAMFAARHARNVSRRVAYLQKKFKKPVEDIVLDDEKRLLSISTAMGQADMRDRVLEMQADGIAKAAAEIAQGQQMSKQAIGSVSEQSKTLEKNLKDASDAAQQAQAKLAEKDNQIKLLSDKIAQLEDKNKAPAKAPAAKAKTSKVQVKTPAK